VEDVVQVTLLEAWYHLPYLREAERFDAWLDGICRNMCRRWRRTFRSASQRYEQLSMEDGEDKEDGIEDIADTQTPDPFEELSRQGLEILMDRALGHLSKSARGVVELCYLAEYPQREVALRLGITIGALEERLRRARQQLRQVLAGELRSDAEELGLTLSAEPALGWPETRLWCKLCGRQRLRGIFETFPDGRIGLCLRCPVCSPRFDGDIIRTGGFFPQRGCVRSDQHSSIRAG
jgi:RNA polymerase sigma factor (sigma-70 family)